MKTTEQILEKLNEIEKSYLKLKAPLEKKEFEELEEYEQHEIISLEAEIDLIRYLTAFINDYE